MKSGEKIIKLRKASKMTQAELGEKLNVTAQAVSKWENDLAEPDIETIKKICEIFDVSANEFFETKEKIEDENEILKNSDNNIEKETAVTTNTVVHHPRYHLSHRPHPAPVVDVKVTKHGFVAGIITASIVALITIFVLVFAGDTTFKDVLIGIAVVYASFAIATQIGWANSVLDVSLFFIKSFRMPGVIFNLSIEGIIKLILIKILFALLSVALSTIFFIIGMIFTGCYASVIFPFALIKALKGDYNI